MYGIFLIILLIVLGGIIAYIGDAIGRKIGKKRLSIFGLRPKYTSIVITIITGIVVVASTLGLLLVFSENVQYMILKTNELIHTLSVTTSDLRSTRRELETTTTELTKAKKELDEVSTEAENLNREVAELTSSIKRKTEEYQAKVAEFEVLSKDYEDLSARYRKVSESLAKTESDLKSAEDAKAQIALSLEKLREDYNRLKKEMNTVTENYNRISLELAGKVKEIGVKEEEISSLKATREHLSKEISELTEEKETLERDLAVMQKEYERLREDAAAIVSKYQYEMTRYQDEALKYRTADLSFYINEIIYARVIDGSKSRNEIEYELTLLVRQAEEIAAARGARSSGGEGSILLFYGSNWEDTIKTLEKLRDKAVVRVISDENTLINNPVNISLKVYPKKLIFKKGSVVASRVIDGQYGKDYVQSELNFLLKDAQNVVTELGMITDYQGISGKIPASQFIDALNVIVKEGKPMKAVIIVTEDTWTTEGPVSWKLEVHPGS